MILDRIRIVLPWPDPLLFPNRRRGNFRKFQPAIEAARQAGFVCAKEALGRAQIKLGQRNKTSVLFVAPNRIRRDLDGCIGAIKHNLDGIALALGIDDSQLRPLITDDCLDIERKGFVIVEIEAS